MAERFEKSVITVLRECPFSEATIEELADYVRSRIDTDSFEQRARDLALKEQIRCSIKSIRDADGLAQYESIECEDVNGKVVKKYCQLALFDREQFLKSINYFARQTHYFARKANSLQSRMNRQLETQLPLPFPNFGLLGDPDAAVA